MRRESRRNERLKERKTLEGKRKRIQGKRGSSRCLLSWLDSSIGAQFFQHLIVFLCLFYSFFRKASFTYVRFLRFSSPSPTPDPLGRYGASRPEALEAIPRHRGESFGIPLASHFILAPPCGREPFYLYLSYSLSLSLSFSLSLSLLFFLSASLSFAYSRFTELRSASFSFVPHCLSTLASLLFGFYIHAEVSPTLRFGGSFVRGRWTAMLVCLHGIRWWPCCGARRGCKRYVGTVPRNLVVAGPASDRTKF